MAKTEPKKGDKEPPKPKAEDAKGAAKDAKEAPKDRKKPADAKDAKDAPKDPKKPADAKDAKEAPKDPKMPADAKGKPDAAKAHVTESGLTVVQEKVKAFFESPYSLYVGAMVLLSSFISAIVLICLLQKEIKKKAVFRTGISNILEFADNTYPESQRLENSEKIRMLANVSRVLTNENRRNDELQHAINDVIHRLGLGWVVFGGNLYLFDEIARPRTWSECVEFCEKKPFTRLLCIENIAEARFATKNVIGKPSDYWIGFFKEGNEWKYLCPEPFYKNQPKYWSTLVGAPGNTGPARPDTTNCVVIIRYCDNPLNCWNDVHCYDKKRCICKLKPDVKWFL